MLFDLRSRRRKRAIKVVYVFLAVLIGGGLILFGVGSGNSANTGLLNNINSSGSGGGAEQAYVNALNKAQKKANAAPNDAAAWAAVGRAAYALATLPTSYDSTQGFTSYGHTVLGHLRNAWTRYLSLAPGKPDTLFAQEVAVAFGAPPTGIGDYRTAETAQEVVTTADPTLYQNYYTLAYDAYFAAEYTLGDQAAATALKLAPKSARKQVQSALASVKVLAAQQTGTTSTTGATSSTAASGSTGASGATGASSG